MMKRSICVILALIICIGVITIMPVTASAGTAQIASTAAKTYAAPKNIKVTKQDNKGNLKVTWSAVKGAPLYAVFVKVGSATSWKRVKYTAKTAYTYSGAKNATKYTFTIRVADKKGRYVSSYNKTGVSLTYNPTWSKLYKDFVQNEKYMSYVPDIMKDRGFSFFLYDIDFNGIPELFVNTGYIAASNVHEIFTFKNGKVVYLFEQPMFYSFSGYAPNSKYKGFFAFGGHTQSIAYTYYYMKSGKWCSEIVLGLHGDMVNGKQKYNFVRKTSNKGLYDAFIAATKAGPSDNKWNRSFRYPGQQYRQDDINSMGWNKFVKKFGF